MKTSNSRKAFNATVAMLMIGCLYIFSGIHCKKAVLSRVIGDYRFFDKTLVVENGIFSHNVDAFTNPVSKEIDETWIDNIIGQLKMADVRDRFTGRIGQQVGLPVWNRSLVFTGGDKMKTVITPLYNPAGKVSGAIFSFFGKNGFDARILPREMIGLFRDTIRSLSVVGRSTLSGLFSYFDAPGKNDPSVINHILGDDKPGYVNTDNVSNIAYTVCWYVPVLVYAPSTVVFQRQCHTEVFWGTYSEWDYFYDNGWMFIEEQEGYYETYDQDEIEKGQDNAWERNSIDTTGFPNVCVESIVKKIAGNPKYDWGNLFGQTFADAFGFRNHGGLINIKFRVADLLRGDPYREGNTQSQNHNHLIELKTDMVKNASELYVANIIIHEMYHVYMNQMLIEHGINDSTILNDFGATFDAYCNFVWSQTGRPLFDLNQHDYVIASLLNNSMNMLKEFDGARQPDSYYWMVAWGGLQTNDLWGHYQQYPMQHESDRNCYVATFDFALTRLRIDSINNIRDAERTTTTDARSNKHNQGCYQ
jgi:hypothetical protein